MRKHIAFASLLWLAAPLTALAGGRGHGHSGATGYIPDVLMWVSLGITALALLLGLGMRKQSKDPPRAITPASDWGVDNPCPLCGAAMVERPNNYHIGKTTYRCSSYPTCTGLRLRATRRE